MQNTKENISTLEPRVSVILPTFNRAAIIAKCIDSLIKQSYKSWELIVCDDCSTDETEEICRQYAEKFPNIQYIKNNARNGLPKNRNIGIKLANGELIFFIEDDLVLEEKCLENLVSAYDTLKLNNTVGGIAPRLIEKNRKIYPDKEPFVLNKFTGEIFTNFSVPSNNTTEVVTLHACSLYPRIALKAVGGYEEKVYIGNFAREDVDLNFRIKKLGYKFYFQPNAVADHNQIKTGGCRTGTVVRREMYEFRNHIIFIIRIFTWKCVYMIPFFIASYSFRTLIYILRSAFNKAYGKKNSNE